MKILMRFISGSMLLGIVLSFNASALGQRVWTNPSTGASAGNWFTPSNWSPAVVPTFFTNAAINNGGEATANSGTIAASKLDVGKNGGTGTLTVSGTNLNISRSLDIGEVEGSFATGPVNVTSSGTVTIQNAASLLVGAGGAGDFDIGQTVANSGATGNGTGNVTLTNITTIDVMDDLDIGETSGTATATGTGTLIIQNSGSLHVGMNSDIGETGSATGTKIANGTIQINTLNSAQFDGDLDLGRTFSTGGTNSGNAHATWTGVGSTMVGGGLTVGLAGAQNGGSATSRADFSLEQSGNLSVTGIFGIGYVRNTLGSGIADAEASATLRHVGTLTAGQGIFIGRTFSRDNVQGTGVGTLTVEFADSIQSSADLDVGQTGASGFSSGSGAATGTGTAIFRDITGAITIATAADIGNASAVSQSSATGMGTLTVERVGSFSVTDDLNIGQTSGAGLANGTGNVTFLATPMITIGQDLDVGPTRGSTTNINQGMGTIAISDANVSVGFANALAPASLNIGNVTSVSNERAHANGNVTLTRVQIDVADRINVGELAGGSFNAGNNSSGHLLAIDSAIDAPRLDVATIVSGTQGTLSGELELQGSLATIAGPATFGDDAIFTVHLAGTNRADGTTTGTAKYGALDATTATLSGDLNILLDAGFTPAAGDSFDILSTTGGITGLFTQETLPALSTGLSWEVLYDAFNLQLNVLGGPIQEGDFDEDGDVDGDDFNLWQSGFQTASGATHTNGDANADGDVDGSDFLIWQTQFSSTAGNLAASSSAVPEPNTIILSLLMIFGLSIRMARSADKNRPRRQRTALADSIQC